MQFAPPRKLLFALAAGCVLLWIAIFIVGVLAALPTPGALRPLLQDKGWVGVTLHSLLLVHIPMAILAGIFGWIVFHLLRARSFSLVLACAAPWVLYCIAEAVSYYQEAQFPAPQKLALLLA